MRLMLFISLFLISGLSFGQNSNQSSSDKNNKEKKAAEFKAAKKLIDDAFEIAKSKNLRVNGNDVKKEIIEKFKNEKIDVSKAEPFLNKIGSLDPNLPPDKLKASIEDIISGCIGFLPSFYIYKLMTSLFID